MTGHSNHRPRRRFGQHFLAPVWARKVVEAIAPAPGDVFLEIGPGQGALTLPLAQSGAPILAVEIDRDLARDLASRVPPHVTVLTANILKTEPIPFLTGLEPQRPPEDSGVAPLRRLRVIGNLPYNLSTPILFRIIDWSRRYGLFWDASLMVQREVADRLTANPGTREYGVLGISAQMHTTMSRLIDLPPGAFTPPPKVRSTVVQMRFGTPTVRVRDEPLFDALIRGLFSQRRKTLLNALRRFDPASGAQILDACGLDGRRRPDTLSLAELATLADALTGRKPHVVL